MWGCLGREDRGKGALRGPPAPPRPTWVGGLCTMVPASEPALPPKPGPLRPPRPPSPRRGGPGCVGGGGGRAQVDGLSGAGGRGCLLPPACGAGSCFPEPSSVLTAADAPPHGWGEREGKPCQVGPPPLNLGSCHAPLPSPPAREPSLRLEVTFSPEASRWVRRQEDPRAQAPGERGSGSPRPVHLARAAGASGVPGAPAPGWAPA